MTKKEIVKLISEKQDLTQLKVKEIVQMVFDSIVDTLIEEERIELRNFGVFEVKKRAARTARNPRTGEAVNVPEKYVVTFKPGKTMEERVLGLEQRKFAESQAARDAAEGHGQGAAEPATPERPSAEPSRVPSPEQSSLSPPIERPAAPGSLFND